MTFLELCSKNLTLAFLGMALKLKKMKNSLSQVQKDKSSEMQLTRSHNTLRTG